MFGSLCSTRPDICIYVACFIVHEHEAQKTEHTASWVWMVGRVRKICICACFHLLSFSMCLYIWFTCLLSCRFARSFVILGSYAAILSIIDFVSRCCSRDDDNTPLPQPLTPLPPLSSLNHNETMKNGNVCLAQE